MTRAHKDLVAELDESSALGSGWRPGFESCDRGLFVPSVVWDQDDAGDLTVVDRGVDPGRWAELVYSDRAVIVQCDEGRSAPGEPVAYPSSSTSQPFVVASMLDALDVDPGHRVLEIGTGTGWNAALLAARLGDENVVSVEVDPTMAEDARAALARAGRHPTVITADGVDGYPPGAPYDRVIATCSVRHVPHQWIEQVRPGGLVLTPWGTWFCNGALLRLTVERDGHARGQFGDPVSFMSLRDQRPAAIDDDPPADELVAATTSTTEFHPGNVFSSIDAGFAIGLRLPRHRILFVDDDPDGPTAHIWVTHPDSGSWARIDFRVDTGSWPVHQYGPYQPWDEVQAAHDWWDEQGRPEHTRFGLTVTPGRQWVWLDSPDRPVLPA